MNALQPICHHTVTFVSALPSRSLPSITASLKLYMVIAHLSISLADKKKVAESIAK